MAQQANEGKIIDMRFDRRRGSNTIRSATVADNSPSARLIKVLILAATVAGTDLAVTGALAVADYHLTKYGFGTWNTSPRDLAHFSMGAAEVVYGVAWGLKLVKSTAIDLVIDAAASLLAAVGQVKEINEASNAGTFWLGLKVAGEKNLKHIDRKIPGLTRVISAFTNQPDA